MHPAFDGTRTRPTCTSARKSFGHTVNTYTATALSCGPACLPEKVHSNFSRTLDYPPSQQPAFAAILRHAANEPNGANRNGGALLMQRRGTTDHRGGPARLSPKVYPPCVTMKRMCASLSPRETCRAKSRAKGSGPVRHRPETGEVRIFPRLASSVAPPSTFPALK
jgi:hypothetical protein